jgi:hypothetical protein
MSVATDVIPLAISIKIGQSGDVLLNRAILIAHGTPIWIVVIRITQVSVVVGVAAIIAIRVSVVVIVVNDIATHTWGDLRNKPLVARRGFQCQQLPSTALAGPGKSNHLGQPAQN